MVQFTTVTTTLLALAGIVAAMPAPSAEKPALEGIPVGAADGIYLGSLKADGSTQWDFIGPDSSTTPSSGLLVDDDSDSPVLAKRDGVTCSGFGVNADDANRAQGKLADMCGGGYYFNSRSIAQVSGGAVAYACNYGNGQTCHSGDVWSFFAQVNSKCGFTNGASAGAGWYSVNSWKAAYGRTTTGSGFC
ncbi:Ankyrin [Macrophomina phaseolina MS6]|uniref:Ankyrin n=2 Tax=Macrophomina phaseolina TaxID=35725 RepID=K2S614_MACPH|nr:Ankyrin [Macrophomina phaseolina MS6]KAH7000828.1 hypothetical protein B0J12DRAFT_612083 [Macrophomina phaseolina]